MKCPTIGFLAAALPLCLPPAFADEDVHAQHAVDKASSPGSPLIQKVRKATARYRDINVALAEGYAPATPCVSGPNSGAMGVHLIKGELLGTREVDATTPEALIYEPTPDGRMRFVGVEILTFASDWVSEVPVLDGHLLHYVGAPNRYGIPAFYEIHVWAWRNNPDGAFADWNPRVSCAGMPLP
jgi:hypothetical protein